MKRYRLPAGQLGERALRSQYHETLRTLRMTKGVTRRFRLQQQLIALQAQIQQQARQRLEAELKALGKDASDDVA